MEYENNDSTFMAGLTIKPSEALEIGFDAVYSNADGSLEQFTFDGVPADFLANRPNQSYDFTHAHTYSDLDVTRLELALTFNYAFNETMSLWGGYRYIDLEDDAPYLYEVTGSVDFYSLGLAWGF